MLPISSRLRYGLIPCPIIYHLKSKASRETIVSTEEDEKETRATRSVLVGEMGSNHNSQKELPMQGHLKRRVSVESHPL